MPTDRMRVLQIASVLLTAIFVPYYCLTLHPGFGIPRDGTSLVVGRDFLNAWMYGRAAWGSDPGRWYDPHLYEEALRPILGLNYPGQLWSYPPTILLITAPFGRLPYLPALALWSVLGLITYIAALRLWTPRWTLIMPMTLSPAAVFGLMSGQYMFFAASATLAALHWRASRPALAGLLIGLLTLKPQTGLIFPILLIATRNWRALAASIVTAALLIGATILVYGMDVWVDYWDVGLPAQLMAMRDEDYALGPFAPTIFSNLRGAGIPASAAMLLQSVCSLAAGGLAWVRFRAEPASDNLHANALLLACSAAAAPYMLSYDLLALSAVATLLVATSDDNRKLLLLVYLLPLAQMAFGAWHVPGPAAIPYILAIILARTVATETGSLRSPESRNRTDMSKASRTACATGASAQ